MCLNPKLIKNVNYGNKSKLSPFFDTSSQFIPVPCGVCSVCLQLKQQYLVQRVQMEALSHDLFFGTLTYNDSLRYVSRGEFTLPYADISDWQKMIKMIRKHEDLPPFKYLVVSEYGGRKHRPHFHFILSFPASSEDPLSVKLSFEKRLFDVFLHNWRRNYGSRRNPDWKPLCTYFRSRRGYNFDLHYLNPFSSPNGLDDVAFYVSKYVLKFDKWIDRLKSRLFFNLSAEDYSFVWNLIRPRRLLSKGFGSPSDPSVFHHIERGIQLSLHDSTSLYPFFISPVDGSTFPLAPYYSKRFLTLDHMDVFNSRKPRLNDFDMMLDSSSSLSLQDIETKEYKFDIIRSFLHDRTTLIDDDFVLSNLYSYGANLQDSSDFKESSFRWEDSFCDCDFDC